MGTLQKILKQVFHKSSKTVYTMDEASKIAKSQPKKLATQEKKAPLLPATHADRSPLSKKEINTIQGHWSNRLARSIRKRTTNSGRIRQGIKSFGNFKAIKY